MIRIAAIVLAISITSAAAASVEAHEGKLPEDALTLVRQAAALLAQDPAMRGEVKERLRAALNSKRPEGVHLDQVKAALQALERNDSASARRLVASSMMPAGMIMSPQRPGGAAAPSVPSSSPAPAPAPAPRPQTVETMMAMAEPLRSDFTGSTAEVTLLVGRLC